MKKFFLSFFVALVISYGALLAFYAHFNKLGYCIPKWHITSDEEKIKIAVERVVGRFPKQHQISKFSEDGWRRRAAEYGITLDDKLFEKDASYKVLTSYSGAEDFLERNPDCCRFEKRNFVYADNDAFAEPTFFDWAAWRVIDRISVDYKLDIMADDGKIYTIPGGDRVHVNNCGYIWID